MTLLYPVKYGNIGFFCHLIREVCIIFLVPLANKSKYAKAIFRQIPIFDTKATDL